MAEARPHFPGQAPIDAYGDGGFRFADARHQGSLLLLPSGIYAWQIKEFSDLVPTSFDDVLREKDGLDFLLLGTGDTQRFPDVPVRALFDEAGLGLEVMDTGAACRTYNVLLGENRAMAAALIAVD